MTKPIPRRSFLRRAAAAGGSERRPSDEGRAAGGGDAARPDPHTPTKELRKPSPMDAATAPRPLDHPTRIRAPPPSIPGAFARRSNRRAAQEVVGTMHAPLQS